jgi:hypothetical protein
LKFSVAAIVQLDYFLFSEKMESVELNRHG